MASYFGPVSFVRLLTNRSRQTEPLVRVSWQPTLLERSVRTLKKYSSVPSHERAGPPSKADELTKGPAGAQSGHGIAISQLQLMGTGGNQFSSCVEARVETHRFSLGR